MMAILMVLSLLSPAAYANGADAKPLEKALDASILQQKAAIAEQTRLSSEMPKLHKDLQGLSGDEEVSVIVHLSESPVALAKGISELKGKAFTTSQANSVQAKVKQQQTQVSKEMVANGIKFSKGFSYNTVLNGFSTNVKADDLDKLLSIEGITLVEPDPIVYASDLGTSTDGETSPEDPTTAPEDEVTSPEDPSTTPEDEVTSPEDPSTTPEDEVTSPEDPSTTPEDEETTEELPEATPVDPEAYLEEIQKVEDEMEASMNTSISFLGIEQLWNEGNEGQGISVAVLDTGIDADHPEFAGIYKGGKNFVPHVGDEYARPRADDDASETSPLDRPAHRPEVNERGSEFHTSHGTHVAGTIAAIGANEFGIKGIAPQVDLYAYRVLGAYGSGSTSGIIAAIEEAVIQEMDVINLSLGGGSNTETSANSFAINNAMLAGTISVVATGNSGPNRGTMGTPSTARLGIAVGNTTNPESRWSADVNVTVGDYTYAKTNALMATTFAENVAEQLAGQFEVVAVPNVGEATDYEGIDVDGKVALVSRGAIAFVDKIKYAKENGAVAILLHNASAGTIGISLGDAFEFIPTFDLSKADGDELRAALANGTGTVTFNNYNSTSTLGDDVNDSSSRGPSTPNFDIKPDVTAPGTNIMSTIPMYQADFPDATYDEAYSRKTGTSMATPHIAGIAALIKKANPDWNAFDVKVALSNTAKILDTTKYDVFAQGPGRVNAYAAAHPEILAYALDEAVRDETGEIVDNIKGTVTFGPQDLKEGDISITKEILVKDIAGNGGDYTVTVDPTKTYGDAVVTVDETSFTLSPNGEQTLIVTLTASQADTELGDEMLGYIHITGSDDTEVSLPFAVDFNGEIPTEVSSISMSEYDLSFDGDGYKDSAILSFTLTGQVNQFFIELWDYLDQSGGPYGDGYIGYFASGSSLGAGSYNLPINGSYVPWDGSGRTTIPDGLYTIDFTAASDNVANWTDPIVVKTTAPKIESEVSNGVVKGQVVDKYIDYNEILSFSYDLNDKLNASYVITKDGTAGDSVEFNLEQDGSFEIPVADLNPETDRVVVTVVDAAGNVGTNEVFPTVYASITPLDGVAEVGSDYEVTLTAKGLDNIVGAQYEIAYDDSVFTLDSVKASEEFLSAAGSDGAVTLTNEELGETEDGKKRVLVGVAYKGEVDGISGNFDVLDLTFSVSNNLDAVGEYTIDLFEGGSYKFVNKDQVDLYPDLVEYAKVTVAPALQDITGEITPEAFLGTDGELLDGLDASKLGASVIAIDENGKEKAGTIHADGSFIIEGLASDKVYSVELHVPGHFVGYATDVHLTNVVDGVSVPTDAEVSFKKLLAGDANGDNVIDISDAVYVARYFMQPANSNPKALKADLNQDGLVNILDLNYVVKNFGLVNEDAPDSSSLEAQLELPNGATFENILTNLN